MGSVSEKKASERAQLEMALRALEFAPERIIDGPEPPDFIMLLDGRWVGVEVTEHHSSSVSDPIPSLGGRRVPRRALEQSWEDLRAVIEERRAERPSLRLVSGWVAFRGRIIPDRKTWPSFVNELLDCAEERCLPGATGEVEVLSWPPDVPLPRTRRPVIFGSGYPGLNQWLSKAVFRRTRSDVGRWGSSLEGDSVGADEAEILTTLGRKITSGRTPRPDACYEESWLLVHVGMRLSQSVGWEIADRLTTFHGVDRLLRDGHFVKVILHNLPHGELCVWTRETGWALTKQRSCPGDA